MTSASRLSVLLLVVFCVCLDVYGQRVRSKRESLSVVSTSGGGKVYVNGREIDAGPNPTVVRSGDNGCTIVNDVVHDCNGKQRTLTDEDRRVLDKYQQEMKEFYKNLFPPGFPFVNAPKPPQFPKFPSICRACSGTNIESGHSTQIDDYQTPS